MRPIFNLYHVWLELKLHTFFFVKYFLPPIFSTTINLILQKIYGIWTMIYLTTFFSIFEIILSLVDDYYNMNVNLKLFLDQ